MYRRRLFNLAVLTFFGALIFVSIEYSGVSIKTSGISQTTKYVSPEAQRFGMTHNWARR